MRGLQLQIYRWPGTDTTITLLLHGYLDSAETFQFMADQLSPQRTLIAADLRGFGRSQWTGESYWFADYLADLEALIAHYSPDRAVNLIGHSMGGNIAGLYAGVCPERVRRLVLLEGFGLASKPPEDAPGRYREWLGELRQQRAFSTYLSYEALAKTLLRRHPHMTPERAQFVARAWGVEGPDGRIMMRADPMHRRVNPVLYRREEARACWQAITAPTLLVRGEQSDYMKMLGVEGEDDKLLACFPRSQLVRIAGCGHMIHYEQPEQLAQVIDVFLSQPDELHAATKVADPE
jgi:pimeloyl-ACP methyl ester carboxylesterase